MFYRNPLSSIYLIVAFFIFGCVGDNVIEGKRYNIIDEIYSQEEIASIKIPKQIISSNWGLQSTKVRKYSPNYFLSTKLQKNWKIDTGISSIVQSPIIKDNIIFFINTDGFVKSQDLATKTEIWSSLIVPNSDVGEKIAGGGISMVDGSSNLYVTTSFGEIASLSIVTGEINWRHKFDSPFLAAPTVLGDSIFTTDASGVTRSLSLTGELRWSVKGHNNIHMHSSIGRPIFGRTSLLIPTSGGTLTAVDFRTGTKIWAYEFNLQRPGYAQTLFGMFNGDPVVLDDKIYFGSVVGQFSSLSLDGRLLWTVPIGLQGEPLVVSNSVFFISDRNKLVRLNKDTGSLIWAKEVSTEKNLTHSFSPLLAGSRLWVASLDNFLRGFNLQTGKLEFKIKLDKSPVGPPAYSSSNIIIHNVAGDFIAFK